MFVLIGIGFVAGIVAGISPCILPVLPVVLAAGVTTPVGERSSWATRARPVSVVAGLIVSFSLLILLGSEVLSALHLPQDLLRDAGIALLVLVGLSFLFPPLATIIERPFVRIRTRQPSGKASGFVVGLGAGALFVPCAGPVLAAITVVGATHKVGLTAVFLTFAFAIGAAIPLLIVGLAGSEIAQRMKSLRAQGPRLRQVSGVVLIVMALMIGFNTFAGLQRAVPGYTSALQGHIEGSTKVRQQLGALTGGNKDAGVSLVDCNSNATVLVNCGKAPNVKGISAWLNTPGDKPLSIPSLKGKVVLVDFWTYSCINCQRTLPHVESWYSEYAKDGLVVVGVHTPEFAFEHVLSNIKSQASALGVKYPVAVDNDYGTWNNYDNEYWPADYLVDASGTIRHVHFGEGDYAGTEALIRQLLIAAHPGLQLPPATEIPDKTPTGNLSPETYIGYENVAYLLPDNSVVADKASMYQFPAAIQLGGFGLSGIWTDHKQEATAGKNAALKINFLASDVYLVLGGTGTLQVSFPGVKTKTIKISGVPKLYTLFHADSQKSGILTLHASPGVQAYDFTFG